MARIAINGFGRIGRQFLRVALEQGRHTNIIAVNDLTDADSLAYLLKYDTAYGTLPNEVRGEKLNEREFTGRIHIDDYELRVLAEPDPAKLPWKELGVDVVIESTGRFTKIEDAKKHLDAGAKRVIISAPTSSEAVDTIVLGVNHDKIEDASLVSSMASCTTNCIAPIVAVLDEVFGVEKAMMTTVHAYTADQNLQDGPHSKDMRRARAAAENIVPTSTGAAQATAKALPQVDKLFDGIAVRVPVQVGSMSDVTAVLKQDATVNEINDAFKKASVQKRYKDILVTTTEPLVSSDIIKNPASCIVDLEFTRVVGGNLVKVVAWYDNEWGYSTRLFELAEKLA
jgi:glyceraldehyde 3-phosphate dehydrogenase